MPRQPNGKKNRCKRGRRESILPKGAAGHEYQNRPHNAGKQQGLPQLNRRRQKQIHKGRHLR